MNKRRYVSRRNFLKLGGGAALATAGMRFLPRTSTLAPVAKAEGAGPQKNFHLAATDGFIALPGPAGGIMSGNPSRKVYPDPLAPNGRTTYIFGFRDVTGYSAQDVLNQKGKAQTAAPLLWVDEEDDVRITLTNLGLQIRPDLVDSHTIHWHGFRNAIPLFDGVPEMSVAVPISSDFTYFYHPHDAGTYMYHCHFEDVEHVQMGMTGIVFVRPRQNKTPLHAGEQYVYNDGNGSTRYDREWGMFLSEMWAAAHYDDAHIQVSDWSEYEPDFWIMNGRCYPDTLAANGDPGPSDTGARLQYQPISSLVKINAGEKGLLRFVSLGYQQSAMTIDGISMQVVGKDATLLRGRDGTDTSYATDTVYIGPGESYDAIFTAPPKTGAGAYDTYMLYNRSYAYASNGGASGLGGQVTEIRVYPAGTLPAQTAPNT